MLTRHQIDMSEIQVTTEISCENNVLMSRTELQQVVVNLILNALYAMPERGRLTLSVQDEDSGVVIKVDDTGKGIEPSVLKRIFDPFFTTKQAEGTGLGLSISQTLISRAGGQITATSAPGQGSRFRVWLPRAVSE